MKIALCLAGKVAGGSLGPSAYKTGNNTLTEDLLSKHETDVFLHTWEPELKDELLAMYNPKECTLETQINFAPEYEKLNPIYNLKSITPYQNVFSMLYGRKSSLKLKSMYETKHGFRYNWVILGRFDTGAANHIPRLRFSPDNKNDCIYFPMYNQINAGPSDAWIYANSENMDYIGELYDFIPIYMQDNNDFITSCLTGWPVSSPDRFSNELFKPQSERSTTLETIPVNCILNTHLLYKWHLHRIGKWTQEIIRPL